MFIAMFTKALFGPCTDAYDYLYIKYPVRIGNFTTMAMKISVLIDVL